MIKLSTYIQLRYRLKAFETYVYLNLENLTKILFSPNLHIHFEDLYVSNPEFITSKDGKKRKAGVA